MALAKVESLVSELRLAFRILAKRPWLSLATVLTLGLGIGANTAIFSVVNSILLRPLPFEDLDRLVQVQRAFQGYPTPNVAARQYVYWETHARSFESLAAYSWQPIGVTLTGDARPERLEGYLVMNSFFEVFGARTEIGRVFADAEDQPGGPLAVVLSHNLWTRRFGADENILGERLRLNGLVYTVVGVMSPEFRYPVTADLWMALQLDRQTEDRLASLTVSGKLREGVSPEMAQEALQPFEQEYLELYGDPNRQETVAVQPLTTHLYGVLRPHLLMLAGSAAFVLLITCANVAHLQLARFDARRRELGARLALGASPSSLLSLLVIESLPLSLLGGVVGLLLCGLLFRPLLAVLPDGIQRFHEVEVDLTVLGFALVTTLVVGVATALIPALANRRAALGTGLHKGGTRGGSRRGQSRWGLALVASEVALTVLSMVGAALLVQNYRSLSQTDPGIEIREVLTAQVALSPSVYDTSSSWQRVSQNLVPALEALPGVRNAVAAAYLPMQDGPPMSFTIPGRDPEEPGGFGVGQFLGVTPGYFELLGIELRRGRTFEDRDRDSETGAVIINQELAGQLWPDEDPVGQNVILGPPVFPTLGDPRPRQIVGVVGDVHEDGYQFSPPPMIYVPLAQVPGPFTTRLIAIRPLGLMLETEVPPLTLTRQVQEEVWAFDGDLPVFSFISLEELLAGNLGPDVALMRLVGLFAALAAVLAAIGIYGVLAYQVSQRTREIGIRMATGADRLRIIRWIYGRGMSAVGIGLLVGLVAAGLLVRLIAGYVVIDPLDPMSFGVVPLLLALLGSIAISLPAYRASLVQPSLALHSE